ncbi:hypothetical protein CPAR01_06954 [Colletotrichum paranaense]|uniref:Uncharacterized protein n=1 Tax=Colletotrichum paranaense TaxID=1914294 RepID=A0ABQ9SNK3_9PEZI|nr:uncharacterized protein CPAR01_06954 [Colletotrichum paranaense]KAK1540965.1 hypothetical protein CPAR01_06954 [Colletotrichum paranaense]
MAVTSTLYTPLVETHFYSTGGYLLSTVYTLQPQTTPFTPRDSTCSILPRAIRCVEAKSEDITSGFTCYGLQFVGETTTSVPTQCFPESYINIWRPFDEFSDIPSLAYPGTACISGWTTACSTDVTETSGNTHAQTWCCPSGWGCLSASNGGIPHRECTSLLSTPTEVWINNVVTTRESESTITTSWTKVSLSNLPRGGPIIINHPVFPLYGKVPPRQLEGARETSLSGGAIAGIVVGIVVLLMALIGCSWFICLKKRKQERGTRLLQRDTAVGRGEHSFVRENHDSKTKSPNHDRDAQEMCTLRPSAVELSSHSRAAEVEGDSRPVELES